MLSGILREKTDRWIAHKRREKLERAYAQGYAKGYAKRQKLWQDWNQRRLECEARGDPFNKPPPFLD